MLEGISRRPNDTGDKEHRAAISFHIQGMDCAEEISAIRAELDGKPGVARLGFDLMNAKLTVEYDPSVTDPEKLRAAVARTGMRAEIYDREAVVRRPTGGWDRWSRTILTATSGLSTFLGFVSHALTGGWREAAGLVEEGLTSGVPTVSKGLYLLAIVTGAWYVIPKAFAALRRLRPDMNLLMTVAVAGAVAIGEWFEAATVAFFFALALALESWSVGRARRAVASLMALSPPKARVRCSQPGCEEMIEVEKVGVGTTVIVLPGERIPLDGTVIAGETSVDQAPITGESVPVRKGGGDEVFGGTINGEGAIEVETTKAASDTTLARIIRMIGDAQSRRAPSEQWVEKFARWYTPAVMIMALVVMIFPPLAGAAGGWSAWFYNGLVLLVTACPCALVISTPVAIVAALTAAARNGVLIKGGIHVETPSRINVVAMDKTGTLTRGRPEIVETIAFDGLSEEEVLGIAASIEARSEHPLAGAVLRRAEQLGIDFHPAEAFQAIKGKGASATVDGRQFWIGSHRLVAERTVLTREVEDQLGAMAARGRSVLSLGTGDRLIGLLAAADVVRPEGRTTVENLRRAGVKKIVMLTGDNAATAETVARETGVDDLRAELLPEDKVAAIEDLVGQHGAVAMVGDGINDAPAMAMASLSVAMGAAGTDAALETADVALMGDDLSKLPWLIGHSRRSLMIIRQNIAGSLGAKVVFLVLAMIGKATLWAAIAADMGMSLLVVFNALRLLQIKNPEEKIIRP